jgi:hypothetical protein
MPDVPEALAAIVNRAVDPDAAKRFQTTPELAAAIDRLDDNGVPKPIKRKVSLPIMAGIVTVLGLAAGGAWWYAVANAPAVEHAAVSVVIADLDNRTGDPTFDRTLEPMLRRAPRRRGIHHRLRSERHPAHARHPDQRQAGRCGHARDRHQAGPRRGARGRHRETGQRLSGFSEGDQAGGRHRPRRRSQTGGR